MQIQNAKRGIEIEKPPFRAVFLCFLWIVGDADLDTRLDIFARNRGQFRVTLLRLWLATSRGTVPVLHLRVRAHGNNILDAGTKTRPRQIAAGGGEGGHSIVKWVLMPKCLLSSIISLPYSCTVNFPTVSCPVTVEYLNAISPIMPWQSYSVSAS